MIAYSSPFDVPGAVFGVFRSSVVAGFNADLAGLVHRCEYRRNPITELVRRPGFRMSPARPVRELAQNRSGQGRRAM